MPKDIVSTTRLPVELDERLAQRAKETYSSKAAIIRQAVAEFLARLDKQKGKT